MKKPLSSILIKPAGPSCNLQCDYCFYLKKHELFEGSKFRMSENILEELIGQAMEQSGNEITFLWQGGEPTLMGLEFFDSVVKYQKKYGTGKTVGNGLQTNGTLLDKKWCNFLSEYNFLVGLSIDGTEEIHDYYRKYSNKNGSWKQVLNSYFNLKEAGVAVNALATLTQYSSKFPEQSYQFFKELQFDFIQYIPVLETNDKGVANFSVSAEDYGKFLVKLWELWYRDFANGNAPNIRTFEAIFGNYLGIGSSECTFSKECGSYLVVEHNGDIYPCDYFVNPELKLGNISTDKLSAMLNSNEQKRFGLKKEELNANCKQCKYLNFCYGGCLKNRIIHKNGESYNYFCESYKLFFDKAHNQLSSLSLQWKEEAIKNSKGKIFDASAYFKF